MRILPVNVITFGNRSIRNNLNKKQIAANPNIQTYNQNEKTIYNAQALSLSSVTFGRKTIKEESEQFFDAVVQGNADEVSELLKGYENNFSRLDKVLRQKDSSYTTVFHLSAMKKTPEILSTLIQAYDGHFEELDSILKMKNYADYTVFHYAAGNDNEENMKTLIKTYDGQFDKLNEAIAMKDYSGRTVFNYAIRNQNDKVLSSLIRIYDGHFEELEKILNRKSASDFASQIINISRLQQST